MPRSTCYRPYATGKNHFKQQRLSASDKDGKKERQLGCEKEITMLINGSEQSPRGERGKMWHFKNRTLIQIPLLLRL